MSVIGVLERGSAWGVWWGCDGGAFGGVGASRAWGQGCEGWFGCGPERRAGEGAGWGGVEPEWGGGVGVSGAGEVVGAWWSARLGFGCEWPEERAVRCGVEGGVGRGGGGAGRTTRWSAWFARKE